MKSKFPAVLIAAVAVLLFFGGQTLINLTNMVTGTLPHGNGGTDVASSGAAGNVLRSTGSAWASAVLAISDLSGSVSAAQLPNPSASTLGGVESFALVSHQFLTDISTSGVPHAAQPACAYLSDAAASCNTDATNASNLGSGTVNAARLPSSAKIRGIPFTIGDPAGSALTAAATTTDYITVPFACSISAYHLQILPSGTITVKFWKIATGTAVPTSSNSINTSGVGISTGTAIDSTTVTDFTTTSVSQNDHMAMNVTAVATAAYVNGVLECDQP